MRVLLSHPPLNASREVTPPLGLCTLAAWLRHQGHDVRILDLDLEIKGRPDGQHIYLSLLERSVADFSPAAVGITSMYNNSLQAERMARAIKACDPSIVTIGGGSHFGALGPQALRRIPELGSRTQRLAMNRVHIAFQVCKQEHIRSARLCRGSRPRPTTTSRLEFRSRSV